MTVTQFLYDKYLGKKISVIVREFKEADDKIYKRQVSPIQEKLLYYENWEERQFAQVDKKAGQPFWFRDVEYIEKVIEIKQSYNYWNLKTMSGFKIRLYPDSELETVE